MQELSLSEFSVVGNEVRCSEFDEFQLSINEYFIFGERLLRYIGDGKALYVEYNSFQKIYPKDSRQASLFDALSSKDIQVVAVSGPAGSGKTLLTMAWIFDSLRDKNTRAFFTKPAVTVGSDTFFGPVPGDISEKFDIFLDSYMDAASKILSEKGRLLFEQWKDSETIGFKPIQFTRGCSWNNTIVVIDEAQNTNWHELKSVLSRLGDGCKAIVLGDCRQRDLPGQDNGFTRLLSSSAFKNSKLTAHVELEADYRGSISRLISEIDSEI